MGSLDDFLDLYPRRNTQTTYRHALKAFFHAIYPNSDDNEYQLADRYMQDHREYKQAVLTFQHSLNSRPPKTIRTFLAAVKAFLVENDIEFSNKVWRRVSRRINGTRARTRDKVPSTAELRNLLMHLPIAGKACTLLLASSGMRVNEALSIQLTDIDLDALPVEVNIRSQFTNTGNRRTVFASSEARDVIKEWLKSRSDYLLRSVNRSRRYPKSLNDSRLFPFTHHTFWMMWTNALRISKNGDRDAETHRYRVHPHVLRKYFRTHLATIIK